MLPKAVMILQEIEKDLVKGSDKLEEHIRTCCKEIDSLNGHFTSRLQPILFIHILQPLITLERFEQDRVLHVLILFEKVFKKSKLQDVRAFFEFHQYVIHKLYAEENKLSDEYKLQSLKLLQTLLKSLDSDLLLELYDNKNAKKLSIVLNVCTKYLKNEKDRKVRLEAVRCIMIHAQIEDENNLYEDPVLMSQIRGCFYQFLPGIAATIVTVCIDDEKCGYEIVKACIHTWTRLVTVLMQNYKGADEIDLTKKNLKNNYGKDTKNTEKGDDYDEKLQLCASLLTHLTAYQNTNVRIELAKGLQCLVEKCFLTIPQTISKVIEILMILSADTSASVSKKASKILEKVTIELNSNNYQKIHEILEILQQNFYNNLNGIPMIFNGIDSSKQIVSINLLIGYLKLFGEGKLKNMLFTQVNLDRLMCSLLTVAELEKSKVTLLEEYSIEDWNSYENNVQTPWKVFKFRDLVLQNKLQTACQLLVQPIAFDIVFDYLVNCFMQNDERRMEATILLNEIISTPSELIEIDRIDTVLSLYLDSEFWNLPLVVDDENCLKDVQNNVVQICLQLEGIGRMALSSYKKFRDFLLKVLYPVLEKAGCGHPLLKSAGLQAISNISKGCEYNSVTELINQNSDYFSHHVINKLRRKQENEKVLNVLSIVVKYSNIDVLPSLSEIIEGALVQSLDLYQEENSGAYLRVFAVFLKSLRKWYNIELKVDEIRTKEEKEEELERRRQEAFKELDNDFSDGTMDNKSAQEMYEEDVASGMFSKDEEEPQNEEEVYKKPEVPTHIKLTLGILERSLNFLPSKDLDKKILVIELLKNGVIILKDHEDELLPIVHKIWSPLVNRFKEFQYPLVINFSFQLLTTLALLSKDFIRRRTLNDVIPSIVKILKDKSSESYLKDKGATYRYTQAYKMQLMILENIDRLVYDLDFDYEPLSAVMEGISPYLSDRQPKPLQEAAIKFVRTILHFDRQTGEKLLTDLTEKYSKKEYWRKNVSDLQASIQNCL